MGGAADDGWLAAPVALPPPGEVRAFELAGLRLVVCNAESRPWVIEDRCPHAGVALSPGRLRGCVLECPFHGGKLDVRDGSPAAPPIRRAARTFAARQAVGGLEVRLDRRAVPS
jgi:nitrite reductase/ring-hydroxylating ferredoxin subunit